MEARRKAFWNEYLEILFFSSPCVTWSVENVRNHPPRRSFAANGGWLPWKLFQLFETLWSTTSLARDAETRDATNRFWQRFPNAESEIDNSRLYFARENWHFRWDVTERGEGAAGVPKILMRFRRLSVGDARRMQTMRNRRQSRNLGEDRSSLELGYRSFVLMFRSYVSSRN